MSSLPNFKVSGQTVNAASAAIRNGTAAHLRDGANVEVEGTVTNDVLIADVVVIKQQANARVEAGLLAVDQSLGTVTLLGQSIKVNADTELRDSVVQPGQPTVKALKDATGALVATRVERTAADPLVVVKGSADSKAPTVGLTLLGIGVATGGNTKYRDASGNLVTGSAFYDAVSVPPAGPTIVHARGVVADLASNVVDATRTLSTTGELEIGARAASPAACIGSEWMATPVATCMRSRRGAQPTLGNPPSVAPNQSGINWSRNPPPYPGGVPRLAG